MREIVKYNVGDKVVWRDGVELVLAVITATDISEPKYHIEALRPDYHNLQQWVETKTIMIYDNVMDIKDIVLLLESDVRVATLVTDYCNRNKR